MKKCYAVYCMYVSMLNTGEQESFPIMENVYLIRSDSCEGAEKKGIQHARYVEGITHEIFLDDQPATSNFMGIRKLEEIEELAECPVNFDKIEIAYSRYETSTYEDALEVLNGDSVSGEIVL